MSNDTGIQVAGDVKVSMREKISYGLGDTACNIVYGLATSILTFFYTDYIGISVGVIGLIILISRVFDGASDVIMGLIVDRTKSKYGKARPWVLWMSIPYAVGCILLFTVPAGASGAIKAIYIFITYNFVQTICWDFRRSAAFWQRRQPCRWSSCWGMTSGHGSSRRRFTPVFLWLCCSSAS